MTMIQAREIDLRLDGDVPEGVVHHGRAWRVIDEPTPIGNVESIYSGLVTHPPVEWRGWRFTARSEDDGDVLVFDVRSNGNGWDLITTHR